MYLVEFIEGCVWWVEGFHVLIVLWVAISWNCIKSCCYIVNSRGDTKQYSDMNKMARRFLLGSQKSINSCTAPSKSYIEEVVKDIHNGERGEFPICLESIDGFESLCTSYVWWVLTRKLAQLFGWFLSYMQVTIALKPLSCFSYLFSFMVRDFHEKEN